MNRIIIAVLVLFTLAGFAAAHDLGIHAPAKPAASGQPAPPPDPDIIRQGGDTLYNAILLPVPGTSSGTTMGYTNDYDEACPYEGSTAPDVVYKLAPTADIVVDIDLLGSAYDTKIYVYGEDLSLIACNDDFYPDYVSKLEAVPLDGDSKYFLVIDGYGETAGEYVVEISEFVPCEVNCSAGFMLEDEPPLVDGYIDNHNGGCNTPGEPNFSNFWLGFCGTSGWYLGPDGTQMRDTDWFELVVPQSGFIEIYGDAEYATFMFELGPQDCDNVAVIQNWVMGPCAEGSITIPGTPGTVVWFWVGPTTFDGPLGEYDYWLVANIYSEPTVATEAHSWSAVKELFR